MRRSQSEAVRPLDLVAMERLMQLPWRYLQTKGRQTYLSRKSASRRTSVCSKVRSSFGNIPCPDSRADEVKAYVRLPVAC